MVAETDEVITILPHVYGQHKQDIIKQGRGEITIPKCSITGKEVVDMSANTGLELLKVQVQDIMRSNAALRGRITKLTKRLRVREMPNE